MTSADSPHEVEAAHQSHGNLWTYGSHTMGRQSKKGRELLECPVPCKTTLLRVSSEGVTAQEKGTANKHLRKACSNQLWLSRRSFDKEATAALTFLLQCSRKM